LIAGHGLDVVDMAILGERILFVNSTVTIFYEYVERIEKEEMPPLIITVAIIERGIARGKGVGESSLL
jgi:hypothetical protein